MQLYYTVQKKAFTLLELMLVVLIFSIISAAIFGVLNMSKQSWQIGITQAELQQEVRRAMNMMIKELRGASSVDQSTFDAGISDDIIKFSLEGATVEFAINVAGYNQDQLVKTTGGVSTILANDIEDMQFELFGGNVVYITLTAQKNTIFGHPVQTALNSQVVLRN